MLQTTIPDAPLFPSLGSAHPSHSTTAVALPSFGRPCGSCSRGLAEADRARGPAALVASAWLVAAGALQRPRRAHLQRPRRLQACKVDAVDVGADAAALRAEVLQVLRTANRPLHLTELGSLVEWGVERRLRHGRFASFVRRQKELWVSGGVVGEATPRAWQPRGGGPLAQLQVLELFSGIGGFRAAFHRATEMAGCAVAAHEPQQWVNFEASKLANEVYSANFAVPYAPLLPKDIRRLSREEVDFADLWILSPPCQPYTRLGRRADLDDPRSRPLQHLASLLPRLQKPPQAVLLENVVGFETSESFEMICKAMLEAGLDVRVFQLSPLQLGIPNRRPRIYLLARRAEQGEPHVGALEKDFPGAASGSRPPRRLAEYLQLEEDLDPGSCSIPLRMLELLEGRSQRWEVVCPESTSSSTFTSGYTTSCFEAHRFGPILAKDDSLPGDEDWCQPVRLPGGRTKRLVLPGEDVRYFSPPELLNLGGFPADFEFPDSVTPSQRYKLIGDSINVDVVAELLHFLIFQWTDLAATRPSTKM